MKKLLTLIVLHGLLLNPFVSFAAEENKATEESKTTDENSQKKQSIWSDISSGAQSLTDSTPEKASELSDGMGNVYDGAVTLSKDSLNGFLEGMDESVILLGKLGYDITDVYINVGLIPDLSFKVARVKTLSVEKQNEILKAQDVGVVMDYIVGKLNQAYDMKVQGYHIKDVKIRLTLSLGATVHFVKNLED
jgi:hypothetical protein